MTACDLSVRFLGSGDAFGSGGRLQSCIMVDSPETSFLIDCGATALIGMKRFGIDPLRIGTILVSHLHGDHYSGLPFLIKETQVLGVRKEPLVVAGPEGLEEHVLGVMRLIFPGPEDPRKGFWPEFRALSPGVPAHVGDLSVEAFPAAHSAMTNPLSLRIGLGGRVIAYSGDTEWSEALPLVSEGADLFICETFEYRKKAGNHLSFLTLKEHLPELRCKRIILTHLGESMLERCGSIEIECARDGTLIEL